MQWILEYIASPGAVIPLLVLLVLVIYYLVSLSSSLRETVTDLRTQMRTERDNERAKKRQEGQKQQAQADQAAADAKPPGGGAPVALADKSLWRKAVPYPKTQPVSRQATQQELAKEAVAKFSQKAKGYLLPAPFIMFSSLLGVFIHYS